MDGHPSVTWFLHRDGRQYGPFPDNEFQAMASNRQVLATDFVWREGFSEWVSASTIPGLVHVQAPPTPPISKNTTNSEEELEKSVHNKKKLSWLHRKNVMPIVVGIISTVVGGIVLIFLQIDFGRLTVEEAKRLIANEHKHAITCIDAIGIDAFGSLLVEQWSGWPRDNEPFVNFLNSLKSRGVISGFRKEFGGLTRAIAVHRTNNIRMITNPETRNNSPFQLRNATFCLLMEYGFSERMWRAGSRASVAAGDAQHP